MAFAQAILRSDVTDLTVVSGRTWGCCARRSKVKRVYYGFVSLDSPPFYDPWFAHARTSGAIRQRRWTRGHAALRLQAAAAYSRRARRLGTTVLGRRAADGHVTPYPAPGGRYETLIAMPALRLDAAFAHLNLGDSRQCGLRGIDPADDLFLMAAERRFLPVERIVAAGTGQIGAAAGAV